MVVDPPSFWLQWVVVVGGWTNPFEKYARQNGFIFPNFRGENKTYLSCHHPGCCCRSPLERWLCWISESLQCDAEEFGWQIFRSIEDSTCRTLHPWKLTLWTQSHGGLVQMIFRFRVIFPVNRANLQGCILKLNLLFKKQIALKDLKSNWVQKIELWHFLGEKRSQRNGIFISDFCFQKSQVVFSCCQTWGRNGWWWWSICASNHLLIETTTVPHNAVRTFLGKNTQLVTFRRHQFFYGKLS